MDLDLQIKILDKEISKLRDQRKLLVQKRNKIRRLGLTHEMAETLSIINNHPGANRTTVWELLSPKGRLAYNNTMTALRRRGLIVNKGTRHTPIWFPVSH